MPRPTTIQYEVIYNSFRHKSSALTTRPLDIQGLSSKTPMGISDDTIAPNQVLGMNVKLSPRSPTSCINPQRPRCLRYPVLPCCAPSPVPPVFPSIATLHSDTLPKPAPSPLLIPAPQLLCKSFAIHENPKERATQLLRRSQIVRK